MVAFGSTIESEFNHAGQVINSIHRAIASKDIKSLCDLEEDDEMREPARQPASQPEPYVRQSSGQTVISWTDYIVHLGELSAAAAVVVAGNGMKVLRLTEYSVLMFVGSGRRSP